MIEWNLCIYSERFYKLETFHLAKANIFLFEQQIHNKIYFQHLLENGQASVSQKLFECKASKELLYSSITF